MQARRLYQEMQGIEGRFAESDDPEALATELNGIRPKFNIVSAFSESTEDYRSAGRIYNRLIHPALDFLSSEAKGYVVFVGCDE